MKIDANKIEKLKVVKINKNNIIVVNLKGEKGIIYISNISNSFIVSLEAMFKPNDTIYGYLIDVEGTRRFYSLKVGHMKKKLTRPIVETGGGYLGILYLVNKIKIAEKK